MGNPEAPTPKTVSAGTLPSWTVGNLPEPLAILKVAGVLINLGLGASALHSLYINCTLLPQEIRPKWFIQVGVVFCGLFFFGISGIVFVSLL